jgi:uncharacterized delta-60 repeat protein
MASLSGFGSRTVLALLLVATSAACGSEAGVGDGDATSELGSTFAQLDPTFGERGRVETAFDPSPSSTDQYHRLAVRRMALQSDGKLLVLSMRGHYLGYPSLARYNTDGTLDASFGTAGRVQPEDPEQQFSSFFLRPDGSILLVGSVIRGVRLRRLLPNGALDPSFGDGTGERTLSLCSAQPEATGCSFYPAQVEILPDGKLLALVSPVQMYTRALLRFDADGRIDPSFGDSGIVELGTANPGGFQPFDSMQVQRDGKILVLQGGPSYEHVLLRRNADGSPDVSFGDGGRVVVPTVTVSPGYFSGVFQSIIEQPDGRLVVAGVADDSTLIPNFLAAGATGLQIVRLTATGAPDPTFGTNGGVLLRALYNGMTKDFRATDPDPRWASANFSGLSNDYPPRPGVRAVLDAQGRLVVAADVAPSFGEVEPDRRDLVLYRLGADGGLDTSFGRTGLVQTSFRSADYLGDVVLRPNGKLLVGVAATFSIGVQENSPYDHDYDQRIAIGQYALP